MTPRRTLSSMSMVSMATETATTGQLSTVNTVNSVDTTQTASPYGGMAELLQKSRRRLEALESQRQQSAAYATALKVSPHRFSADE